MELTNEQKKVIAETKDIKNITQTNNGWVFIETKPPQTIPVILKGMRVKATSPKTKDIFYGIVKSIKGNIAIVITDDGKIRLKSHINFLSLSDKPYNPPQDTRKTFNYSAWIHPKNGGDDYQEKGKIKSDTEKDARINLEKHLKRISVISNDYLLTEVIA
jgi:hypothetical protein